MCEHTHLRWVNQKAECIKCGEFFTDYEYDPGLVGIFPKEELREKPRSFDPFTVNSTFTLPERFYWRLDE